MAGVWKRRGLILLLGLGWPALAGAWFERHQPVVVVTAPFIELHTGPGQGYPVFYVAGAGEQVTVLKRRTTWFKVRVDRGHEGWVHSTQMRETADQQGVALDIGRIGREQFHARRWETGVAAGDFGGAASISGYLGYALTPNITVQLEGTQILGDFSDGLMATASILMFPFPEWRIAPFFTIGTGIVRTEPHSTIVQAEDREDEIVHAGVGASFYLTDRFLLRAEYRRHTVLTSRDDNEEIDQWKAGFSVFF